MTKKSIYQALRFSFLKRADYLAYTPSLDYKSYMQIVYEFITKPPNDELVDSIVELYRAGGWWGNKPNERDNLFKMIPGSFCFAIAKRDSRIIGMARAISDGVSDAYIQDVIVLQAYRSQGIGRELVRLVTNKCQEANIGWIGLIAEPGTESFYRALGYGPLQNYQPMLFGTLHRGKK